VLGFALFLAAAMQTSVQDKLSPKARGFLSCLPEETTLPKSKLDRDRELTAPYLPHERDAVVNFSKCSGVSVDLISSEMLRRHPGWVSEWQFYAPVEETVSAINYQQRVDLIGWAFEISRSLRWSPQTFFCGVNMLDRYLSIKPVDEIPFAPAVVTICALHTSAKLHEVCDDGTILRLEELCDLFPADKPIVAADVAAVQNDLVGTLEGRFMTLTQLDFATIFIARMRDCATWQSAFARILEAQHWPQLHMMVVNLLVRNAKKALYPCPASNLAAAALMYVLDSTNACAELQQPEMRHDFLSNVLLMSEEQYGETLMILAPEHGP